MAGTYDYESAPKDVYKRHSGCNCTVEYDPGTGKCQNVHTKKWYETDDETLEKRKTVGLKDVTTNKATKPTLKLLSEKIPKSVGAMARNYDVLDFVTGEYYHIVEGTWITNKEVFAGKGTTTVFRLAEKYAEKYGGNPREWMHIKGKALLRTKDGDFLAEIHWAELNGEKFDIFVKKWLE